MSGRGPLAMPRHQRDVATERCSYCGSRRLLHASFVSASVYEKPDDTALAMLAAMTGGAR